ncbi:MAG: hypothetical protein ACKO8I_07795, partial [Cyanobacteriota bacterium]
YLQDVFEAFKSIDDVMNCISMDEYRNKRAVSSAVERSTSLRRSRSSEQLRFFLSLSSSILSRPPLEQLKLGLPLLLILGVISSVQWLAGAFQQLLFPMVHFY